MGMLEEIFTHTDCHTLDLAEWFGEEETPTEIVGGNEWVVLVAMF